MCASNFVKTVEGLWWGPQHDVKWILAENNIEAVFLPYITK